MNSLVLFFALLGQTPDFQEYKPIRIVNSKPVLTDIESHLPANHWYATPDLVTYTHEGTHGVNALLRNQEIKARKTRVNCFYVLENRYITLVEPDLKLSFIGQTIPVEIRGPRYQLYLVDQAKYWDKEPLYILDEWVAYTNGSVYRKVNKLTDREDSIRSMMEFDLYAVSMLKTVKQIRPNYDSKSLSAFIKWNIDRSFEILESKNSNAPTWSKLRLSSDKSTVELRNFIIDEFGAAWAASHGVLK